MRTIIAILLIVVGISNAAYLGIPAISKASFVPVRAAGWQSHQIITTGEKLEASGAALLWSSTLTSLTVLPWLKESQRRKWYIPIACAYLGGAALYLTGRLLER